MRTWLVCKKCDVKEWLNKRTKIEPCPKCGSARFTENDAGTPMFIWSEPQDPSNWNPQ